MDIHGLSPCGELELLQYRQKRIEDLLSDDIVSEEMERQLRQTLTAVGRQVEWLKACQIASAQRHAA